VVQTVVSVHVDANGGNADFAALVWSYTDRNIIESWADWPNPMYWDDVLHEYCCANTRN
jgi:hypothetical protein